jgi:anti-anti-sigma factor
MEIKTVERSGVTVLSASGRASASEAKALSEAIEDLRKAPGGRAVIDVSLLENVPSAAVGSLLETIRAMEAAGGRLILAAPTHGTRLVLDRLGVASMVQTAGTLAEALELAKTKG